MKRDDLTQDAFIFLIVYVQLHGDAFKGGGNPEILLSPVFQFMELMSDKRIVELRREVEGLKIEAENEHERSASISRLLNWRISMQGIALKGGTEKHILKRLEEIRDDRALDSDVRINDVTLAFLFLYTMFNRYGLICIVKTMQKLSKEPLEIGYTSMGRTCIVFNELVSKTTLKKWVDDNYGEIKVKLCKKKYIASSTAKQQLFRDLQIFLEKEVYKKKIFSISNDSKRRCGFNVSEDGVKKIAKRFKRDIFDKYFVP